MSIVGVWLCDRPSCGLTSDAPKGWRRRIFGEKALELKAGRLALTMERGKVVTLEWQDVPAEPDEAQVA